MNFVDSFLDKIRQNKKNNFWLFLILLILLTSFMMFCHHSSSKYTGFDFFFHYRRLHSLIEALRNGSFPYYIDYQNIEGYGYFYKGFYSDVILIPFALLGLFTSTYFAYDALIFTMTILCGIFTYYTVQISYKNPFMASIAGILYTFAVYRLYDIYHRAALGEALSFTFLPIVFLGLYYVIQADYRKWYILSIGYSLLIFTHVIASVLMFVTLVIILIFYYKSLIKEPIRIAYLFLAGLVTVFIVSYYLFPMIEQVMSNSFYLDSRNPGGGAGYGKVSFYDTFWGFLSGIFYRKNVMWSGIGIVLTAIVFLRFFVKNDKSEQLRNADIYLIIGILYVIATTQIFPWGRFPFNLLSFIQFPWRLYEFISYFFAIAGSYYLAVLFKKNNQRLIVFTIVVILTSITIYFSSSNYKHLYSTKAFQLFSESYNETPSINNGYHIIGQEYLPTSLSGIEYVHKRGMTVESKKGDTEIIDLKRDNNITSFEVINIATTDTLRLPLIYYLGYSIIQDGRELLANQAEDGLIDIVVQKPGRVVAYYSGTLLQKVSTWISIISIIALVIYIVWTNRKENEIY